MAATVTRAEDEILAEIRALDEKKQAIRGQQLALHGELSLARAQAKLAAMPDAERVALLQVIQANGVKSGEAVG